MSLIDVAADRSLIKYSNLTTLERGWLSPTLATASEAPDPRAPFCGRRHTSRRRVLSTTREAAAAVAQVAGAAMRGASPGRPPPPPAHWLTLLPRFKT